MEERDIWVLVLVPIVLAVLIAIILLLREVVCWYFKINLQVKLQRKVLETMLKIYEQNGGEVNWEDVNKI